MTVSVSVVVPLFNHSAFVGKAVASILAQTLGDLELIVVDDGSTDDGAAVVAGIPDSRLVLLRCERGGTSRALNAGIRAARGSFVAIMGSDDVSEPERLSVQTRDMERSGLDAVFCLPTLIDEDDRPFPLPAVSSQFKTFSEAAPKKLLRNLFYEGNFICAPTMCARREVFDLVGPFHEGLIQVQDWQYWIRMAGRGLSFAARDEHLVRYRRHGRNLSSETRKLAAYREFVFVWRNFFAEAVPRLVRQAFSDILDPCADLDTPLVEDQVAMIYLSHPRADVRELFSDRLIDARRSGLDLDNVSNLRFAEYFDLLNRP